MTGAVLLTGFGAFEGTARNPSAEVAEALHGASVEGWDIHSVVLPVSTARVGTLLGPALAETEPDVVIALGVAPGRPSPALERVAINVRDFPIPDVDGDQPVDEPIIANGPAAYLTSLPVKAILQRWQSQELPGYVSNTAGTYVCNQVFYLLAAEAAATGRWRCGLIHLPSSPAGAIPGDRPGRPEPSMAVELTVEAVRSAIGVAVGHQGPDAALAAGAVG